MKSLLPTSLPFYAMLVGAVLFLDQISKWWILNGLELAKLHRVDLLPFLSFTLVWNEGISMGLPVEEIVGDIGLIALTGAITLWLVWWMLKSRNRFERLGLALVIGGAIGNLIDRLMYGAVVDFIHFHALEYSFYVFNVADAAITIGVITLIVESVFSKDDKPQKKK